MGWHGPIGGYKSVAQAIADNFSATEIAEVAHSGRSGDGVGWVRGEASTFDGAPWICCVLVEGGMVKVMGIECGPYYYSCPIAWLDLVPQRAGQSEAGWRATMRERAAAGGWGGEREARRVMPSLFDSAVVVPSGGVSCDD